MRIITALLLIASLWTGEKPLVSCELRGQLGNQMWEIATTVAYALEHGYRPIFPKLKEALHGEDNLRYFFHRLDLGEEIDEASFTHYREAHSHTYEEIPDFMGKNLFLHGHFESPAYFEKYGETIRELFAPTPEILEEINQKYGSLLKKGPLVALHVRTYIPDRRRPDQVGFAGATWNYFLSAMERFPPDAHFVVFSDAPGWTQSRFPRQGKKITFIQGNPYYIDFYLMTLCDHVIVSPESTFSWWAAWLNQNPNKIVVVADEWGEILNHNTIPAEWIQIPKKGD